LITTCCLAASPLAAVGVQGAHPPGPRGIALAHGRSARLTPSLACTSRRSAAKPGDAAREGSPKRGGRGAPRPRLPGNPRRSRPRGRRSPLPLRGARVGLPEVLRQRAADRPRQPGRTPPSTLPHRRRRALHAPDQSGEWQSRVLIDDFDKGSEGLRSERQCVVFMESEGDEYLVGARDYGPEVQDAAFAHLMALSDMRLSPLVDSSHGRAAVQSVRNATYGYLNPSGRPREHRLHITTNANTVGHLSLQPEHWIWLTASTIDARQAPVDRGHLGRTLRGRDRRPSLPRPARPMKATHGFTNHRVGFVTPNQPSSHNPLAHSALTVQSAADVGSVTRQGRSQATHRRRYPPPRPSGRFSGCHGLCGTSQPIA